MIKTKEIYTVALHPKVYVVAVKERNKLTEYVAFDNREAAEDMYKYYRDRLLVQSASIECCTVYNKFEIEHE